MHTDRIPVPAYLSVPCTHLLSNVAPPMAGSLESKVLYHLDTRRFEYLHTLYEKVQAECRPGLTLLEVAQAIEHLIRLGLVVTGIQYLEFQPKPAPFHLVWVDPNTSTQLRGSTQSPRKRHNSLLEASQEAERLATADPKAKVYVLTPVAKVNTEVTVKTNVEKL